MTLLRSLTASGLVAFSMLAVAQAPLRLVTEEEARRPDAVLPTTRAITRGPGVKLLTATDVAAGGFPLKVTLERRGGVPLDAPSLRVEYLKEPIIDLTDRVRSRLSGDALDIPLVVLPAGDHHFRVSVKDSEGRPGSALFSIRAR